MSKITTNESFISALASLSLQEQRLVGARFIKNVLDLTEDKHIIHAQSIAATSGVTAEDLHEAYHTVHASYVKTNPRSDMLALVWEKQAEHFVAEACMACLAPAYPEAATHHLAQRVSMYCLMARTCASINHEGDYPTFETSEEVVKKEVNEQYRVLNEFLDNQ
jgi:ketopantoate reductase